MKAVVVAAGGGLAVATVPDPAPGPGELVLRVSACGICGSDLHVHERGLIASGSIMGHEFAGEVAESAHGFVTGERVCALPGLGLPAHAQSQAAAATVVDETWTDAARQV